MPAKSTAARAGAKAYKKKEDPNKLSYVPMWKMFGKATLRSWPDENGTALLSEHTPPHQYFTLEKARELVTADTSQLVKVPAAGFQNTISALVAGQEVLQCVPSETPSSHEDFAKLKLVEARKILCNKDVLKATEVVHLPLEKFQDKRGAEKSAKTILEYFGDKEKATERLEVLGRLADEGSRLYAAAMASIELIALATSMKEWGKKVPEVEKQPASIRKFSKTHKKEDLFAALASGVTASAEKSVRKKRYGFGEDLEGGDKSTSGESSNASDSNSGSSSSSASDDKKKKRNKKKGDKKKSKRARKDSDGSDDKQNKKKRKRGSARTEKKEKKSDDSDDQKQAKRGAQETPTPPPEDEDLFAEEAALTPADLFADEPALTPAQISWASWSEPAAEALLKVIADCDGMPKDLISLQAIAHDLPEIVAAAAGLSQSRKSVAGLVRMARAPTTETFVTKVKKTTEEALAWMKTQKPKSLVALGVAEALVVAEAQGVAEAPPTAKTAADAAKKKP